MKYLPFLTGTYSTAPGLTPITKSEGKDRLIFHIDETYEHYIENKNRCCEEDITKYYHEEKLQPITINAVNAFIVEQLLQEYPTQFERKISDEQSTFTNHKTGDAFSWNKSGVLIRNNKYSSLFDALANQVQEDLAIFQLLGEDDYLSAIHLCAPNHWSPAEKIGKPFTAIHTPVPAMERTLLHYKKMLSAIAASPMPSTRFAWGIATDTRLNHHPIPRPNVDPLEWHGRQHDSDTTWYIRSERQNFVGFPEANAFLFTIRTYFYPVDELTSHEKSMLLSAVKSMSAESLRYKGLTGSISLLEDRLQA